MNGQGCAQVSRTAQRVTALPGADDNRCADVWGLIGERLKVRIGAPARRHVLAHSDEIHVVPFAPGGSSSMTRAVPLSRFVVSTDSGNECSSIMPGAMTTCTS